MKIENLSRIFESEFLNIEKMFMNTEKLFMNIPNLWKIIYNIHNTFSNIMGISCVPEGILVRPRAMQSH